MIAKTFTPGIGAKPFAIMVAAAAGTGGKRAGVASEPGEELAAGEERFG
jgi:hypothetical protein